MKIDKTLMAPWLAMAAVATLFIGEAAVAQTAKINAGTLTCKGEGNVGLIVGSIEKLMCTYAPSGSGVMRDYSATITRIGLDVGVRGKSTLVWAVLGSSSSVPGDDLGGTFAGVSADVAAGIGAGANVLLGGNQKSVALQPLSVSGGTGINLALGISGLKLVPIRY